MSEKEKDQHDDAFYCARCNEWCEPRCNDPNCWFCNDRPERPLDMEKAQETL